MAVTAFDSPILGGLYGDAEVAAYLDARAEIAAMLRFEASLARVQAQHGVIPDEAATVICRAPDDLTIDPVGLGASEAGGPVPGLVRELRARIGPPHGDFVHLGATSQDAMDTGLVLRLRGILGVLETRLRDLVGRLTSLAERHTELPMAGRTRSQTATPTTFGLRIAGWMALLDRCLDRLDELRPRFLIVQLGGATGNLSVLGDKGVPVMEALAAELGLGAPAKPWHVERDGIVELANLLAMVSGLIGRFGADLILLGRSETAARPQKSNPVLAETLVTRAGRACAAGAAADRRTGRNRLGCRVALPAADAGGDCRRARTCRHTDHGSEAIRRKDGQGDRDRRRRRTRRGDCISIGAARRASGGPGYSEGRREGARPDGSTSLAGQVAVACAARGIPQPAADTAVSTRTSSALVHRLTRMRS